MSKGSKPRPFTNKEIFDDHFDRIFRKKKLFPKETPKEYEFVLHPSTGEVEKKFNDA